MWCSYHEKGAGCFEQKTRGDGGFEGPATSTGIAKGLVRLLTEPGLLDKVGLDFEAFVSRHNAWDSIVMHYTKLYHMILNPTAINKRTVSVSQAV